MKDLTFSDLKFMSIGSNCADIYFLGENRLRGPVDNLYYKKGFLNAIDVLNGTLLESVKNKKYTIRKEGKSDVYDYDCGIHVGHNNPSEDKYIEEFQKRYDRLMEFINSNESTNYLTYSINRFDVKENWKPFHLNDNFYKGLEGIKQKNLLDRIIFVGTKNHRKWKEWARYHSDDFLNLGVKYIEINDIHDKSVNYKEFKNQIIKLLNLKG